MTAHYLVMTAASPTWPPRPPRLLAGPWVPGFVGATTCGAGGVGGLVVVAFRLGRVPFPALLGASSPHPRLDLSLLDVASFGRLRGLCGAPIGVSTCPLQRRHVMIGHLYNFRPTGLSARFYLINEVRSICKFY